MKPQESDFPPRQWAPRGKQARPSLPGVLSWSSFCLSWGHGAGPCCRRTLCFPCALDLTDPLPSLGLSLGFPSPRPDLPARGRRPRQRLLQKSCPPHLVFAEQVVRSALSRPSGQSCCNTPPSGDSYTRLDKSTSICVWGWSSLMSPA